MLSCVDNNDDVDDDDDEDNDNVVGVCWECCPCLESVIVGDRMVGDIITIWQQ